MRFLYPSVNNLLTAELFANISSFLGSPLPLNSLYAGQNSQGKCAWAALTVETIKVPQLGAMAGEGGGGGVSIHMPMIRLETAENHQMYWLMPSRLFYGKNPRLKQ